MPTAPVLIRERVSRARPAANPDAIDDGVSGRCSRYGEDYAITLLQKSHGLADEGSYLVFSNPTGGTGIASAAAPTAFPAIGATDTKPFLVFQNLDQPGDPAACRLYFDYVRFRCTAPGTNGTSIDFAVILDVANAPRAPSGGSSISAVNPNMDMVGDVGRVSCSAGAVTVSSTSTGRLLPNVQLRTVIPVVGDQYIFSFGATEYTVGSLPVGGTLVAQQTFGYPPLIIGPGQWALFYLILPAQSVASSYEFDCGMFRR